MKKYALLLFGVVFTFVNVMLLQQWKIDKLNAQVKLAEMRANINTEWTNELLSLRLNDIHELTKEQLIAQGRLEGVVAYLDGDNRDVLDNLWHEGYTRGLSQLDWEYDTIAENHYQKGYHAAMQDTFPEHPNFVNRTPREVKTEAIKTPDFDKTVEGSVPNNKEQVDILNAKIENLFETKENKKE
tara:strand:+ start:2163 stop:2717 length:555 start_codon:yes stop_codon:yes gene_type:complete